MRTLSIPILLSFILLLCQSISAEAIIKFKDKQADFGEIESGKVADLKYEFENVGDSVLIIKNVTTSCGCTVTRLDKKEYQPGEKGVIPVKFFSKGYNGKVVKTVTVITNDKDNVYSRLSISGTVILKDFALAILEPDRINFEEVNPGKKYTQTFAIKNTGTSNLKIIEVTHTPEIYLEFDKTSLNSQEETKVNLVYKPMAVGRFLSFIKIKTNAYRQSISVIKIEAEVKEEG